MTGHPAPDRPFRVGFDGSFEIAAAPTTPPPDMPAGDEAKGLLEEVVEEIGDLQEKLYAHDRYALLLVFQAMDAAGKDSTIRAVTTGVNPAGFQVFSFKAPSREELDHDFLWRTTKRLPERGRIGVFNRSYYEEVLVVRVHPEFLEGQHLPNPVADLDSLWERRFESIREHEAHLARSGTVVLKFFLHVSREEQARRFLRRLERPDKHWKFNAGDLRERELWPSYMEAYQAALRATSRPHAPWYAIPADDKPAMRLSVARLIRARLESLPLEWPDPDPEERARFGAYAEELRRQI